MWRTFNLFNSLKHTLSSFLQVLEMLEKNITGKEEAAEKVKQSIRYFFMVSNKLKMDQYISSFTVWQLTKENKMRGKPPIGKRDMVS